MKKKKSDAQGILTSKYQHRNYLNCPEDWTSIKNKTVSIAYDSNVERKKKKCEYWYVLFVFISMARIKNFLQF